MPLKKKNNESAETLGLHAFTRWPSVCFASVLAIHKYDSERD